MILFIVFLFLLDGYAYRMIRRISYLNHRTWIFWVFNGLVYLYFLSLYFNMDVLMSQGISIYARAFVIIYFFAKAAFIIPLLLDDIWRILHWVIDRFKQDTSPALDTESRKLFLKRMSVSLGALPFMVMGYGVMRNIYRYRVIHQKLRIKDLHPDLQGLRIVQISDIHSGTFPDQKPVMKGVEMINELNPDLFVFTGDLVNSKADEIDPFLAYFDQIQARYGKYSVMGNHDYGDYHGWSSKQEKQANDRSFEEKHKHLGWDLLRNEHRKIKIGNSELGVIGVENYSTLARFPKKGDLAAASDGIGQPDFCVLLSHDPTHWDAEVTSDYQNIHLTLSGHTHGFQFGIEIPGWIRWSPAQYIYKQWAGLYQTKDQFLYVNRGYGVLGYPGRVGILPEITLIELETA